MGTIDKALFKNCHSPEDTLNVFHQLFQGGNMPLVWLCMEHQLKISKKKNTPRIEDEFLENSEKEFFANGFSAVTYMERLGNNGQAYQYRNTIIKEDKTNELIILEAQFSPFESRNDHMLGWTIAGTIFSMGFLLLMFSIAHFDEVCLREFEDKNRIW